MIAFLLLPNLGYWCLAPFTLGDSGIVLGSVATPLRWLLALTAAALYWWTTRMLFRQLAAALANGSPTTAQRGKRLAWSAYAVGIAIVAAAAVRQVGAAAPAALSGWPAAIASLAGMSGLLWGVAALWRPAPSRGTPLRALDFNRGVAALAIVSTAAFVILLGQGLHYRGR